MTFETDLSKIRKKPLLLRSEAKQNKISAIFIDFHGTISENVFWSSCEAAIYNEAHQAIFASNNNILRNWMIGAVHSAEVCESLSEEFGRAAESYCSGLYCDLSTWVCDQDILCSVQKLKNDGLKIFLISDNMDVFDYWLRKSPLYSLFDYVWVSCDNGHLKNERDGLAYRKIMEKFSLDPADCILIDDSEKSVITFQEIGGISIKTSGVVHTVEILRDVAVQVSTDI
jgi:FMN phosphatase YigB (HAD superfamily)